MKTITVTILLFFSLFIRLSSQSNHFEFELDPIAYAIGGGSGHIAFTWKNERIQLGYGQLSIPKFMRNHEELDESFKAIALKWDYFFGKENASQGFFAGPTFDILFVKYANQLEYSLKEKKVNIGIRGGYKFNLFKNSEYLNGLYLTPWIGTSWSPSSNSFEIQDHTYSKKAFTFFPTLHLGWSF